LLLERAALAASMRLMRCFHLCVAGITFLALASSAGAQREVVDWRTFMISDFGTSIEAAATETEA
jgi:hypothetical protein